MSVARVEYDQSVVFTKELIKADSERQVNAIPEDFVKFEGMTVSEVVGIKNTPSDARSFDACMLFWCHYASMRREQERKKLEKLGIFLLQY